MQAVQCSNCEKMKGGVMSARWLACTMCVCVCVSVCFVWCRPRTWRNRRWMHSTNEIRYRVDSFDEIADPYNERRRGPSERERESPPTELQRPKCQPDKARWIAGTSRGLRFSRLVSSSTPAKSSRRQTRRIRQKEKHEWERDSDRQTQGNDKLEEICRREV